MVQRKCSVTRRLPQPTENLLGHSKMHYFYTSCNNPSAFGSRIALKQTCIIKQVDNYLNRSKTYSKFKRTRNGFLRLKVQSCRLNEIWSIDLSDIQILARHNHGENFIMVVTLSRFVCAMPLKRKAVIDCKNALQSITNNLNSRGNN